MALKAGSLFGDAAASALIGKAVSEFYDNHVSEALPASRKEKAIRWQLVYLICGVAVFGGKDMTKKY